MHMANQLQQHEYTNTTPPTPLEQRTGQEFPHILCNRIIQTRHSQASILGMGILDSLLSYGASSEELWMPW